MIVRPEGRNRAGWDIHLEAVIEHVWWDALGRPWSCGLWSPKGSIFAHALAGRNRARLEIHSDAVLERCWRCTSRPWVCQRAGCNSAHFDQYVDAVEWWRAQCCNTFHQFVNWLLWECDRWHYIAALMESWLMAVDCVGRHSGSWNYIQTSTLNRQNEGNTNNVGWTLYTVYAVLCACCTRCMLYLAYAVLRVNSFLLPGGDREGWRNFVLRIDGRVVDEIERVRGWWWELSGDHERICKISGATCLIGLERPRVSVDTHRIGTHTCCLADGQLTISRKSLKSQFLMMISLSSSHHSLSHP